MTRSALPTRPTMVRTLLMVVAAVVSSGCATTWTLLELTKSDWHQGEVVDRIEPLGPRERKAHVSAAYVPPPRPVAAPVTEVPPAPPPEPQPGAVVVEPQSAPQPSPVPTGRPLPQGGLQLTCTVEHRFERERISRRLFRYDGVWRVLAGFLAISEGAIAGLSIATGLKTEGVIDWVPLLVGAYAALDALGTTVLAFHPQQELRRVQEGPGQWRQDGKVCPAGLGVEVSTGLFPVAPTGNVGELEPWLLQHVVESTANGVTLRLGNETRTLMPTRDEKCAWSELASSPAPYCRNVSRGLVSAEVTFQLPSDAPVVAPTE